MLQRIEDCDRGGSNFLVRGCEQTPVCLGQSKQRLFCSSERRVTQDQMDQRAEARTTRSGLRSRNFDNLQTIGIARRRFLSIGRYEYSDAGMRSFFNPCSTRRLPIGIAPNAFIAPALVVWTENVFVVETQLWLDIEFQHSRVPPDDFMTAAFRNVRTGFDRCFGWAL